MNGSRKKEIKRLNSYFVHVVLVSPLYKTPNHCDGVYDGFTLPHSMSVNNMEGRNLKIFFKENSIEIEAG